MPAPYLRNASDSRFTTLGRELTIVEGDQQFIYLKDQIDNLKSVAGLTPYNAGTTYVGGKTYVVGYGSKAWLFISSTDQTGVTPGTNGAVWEEVNPNALTHQQNTDTYLGYGTSNEVSASEIRNYLNAVSAPVALIHADFLDLFLGGTLTKDVVYNITDKSLYVRAMSNRSIEPHGLYERVVPNWEGFSGGLHAVWTPDAEPGINNKLIFADKVYKNLTGTNLTTIPPDDLDNWEEVSGNTTDYKTVYYGCGIMYRKDGNLIEAYDFKTVMGDVFQFIDYTIPSYNSRFNNSASLRLIEGSATMIEANVGLFIFLLKQNRGLISGNTSYGSHQSSFSVNDSFLGELKDNYFINTEITVASGNSSSFKFNRNIVQMKRSGTDGTAITLRNNAVIEDCVINSEGSTAVDTLNGSTAVSGNTLNLNANGSNDAYGVFVVGTADISIDSLSGFPAHFNKIILKPAVGKFIDITTLDAPSVSANGQLVDVHGAGGLETLDGSLGQYAIIEKSTNQGFSVFKVLSSF